MSLITLKDAGITLGTPLFTQLDLTLQPGDRLAMVAPNGRGKSTLLMALAGQTELTEGQITRKRGLVMGLLAQDVSEGLAALTAREVVLQAVEEGEEWRADVALDELEIPEAMRDLPLSGLSGGWQRLVMLARVAVRKPDLILLDEPTNHLGIEGQEALEDELTDKSTAVLLVNHDRNLIRDVGTRFWWIDKGKLTEVESPEPFVSRMLTSGD